MYITHTDPINFISAPNPFQFRSESVIIYIRHQIRNRSLYDSIRIQEKNVVNGMVEAKSNPIRLHPICYLHPRDMWNSSMDSLACRVEQVGQKSRPSAVRGNHEFYV